MGRETRAAIFAFGILVVGMSVIPPVLFGGQPTATAQDLGDPWVSFIFNYQTLIAGVLAVGAAYATVRQMQRSDIRSDERHEELVRFGLRADKIKVERFLTPQFSHLERCFAEVARLNDALAATSEEHVAETVAENMDAISSISGSFHEILNRPIWIETADLFHGSLAFCLDNTRLTGNGFTQTAGAAYSANKSRKNFSDLIDPADFVGQLDRVAANHSFISAAKTVPESTRKLKDQLAELLSELKVLAAFYRIRL
jgi:hypothetical protein